MIPILKLWEMTQIGQLMLRFVNYNVDQQTILTCPAMSPCHIWGSSACVTRNGADHCVFLQNNDVMDYFLTSSNLHPGSYERPSSPFAEDPPVWWNKNCDVNLKPALEACTNSCEVFSRVHLFVVIWTTKIWCYKIWTTHTDCNSRMHWRIYCPVYYAFLPARVNMHGLSLF